VDKRVLFYRHEIPTPQQHRQSAPFRQSPNPKTAKSVDPHVLTNPRPSTFQATGQTLNSWLIVKTAGWDIGLAFLVAHRNSSAPGADVEFVY
jgi:hypothetical protein